MQEDIKLNSNRSFDEGAPGDACGDSESDARNPKIARRARKDKNRLHATRHGILSRHPMQALVNAGENLRVLRRIKRLLREELRPRGALGEIFFDRAWSSYLRCVLISRAEVNIFAPESQAATFADPVPMLREAHLPTLVYGDSQSLDVFSGELLKHLAVVQRYDSHFSREFYRAVGMLLAMRDAGESGLTDQLSNLLGP